MTDTIEQSPHDNEQVDSPHISVEDLSAQHVLYPIDDRIIAEELFRLGDKRIDYWNFHEQLPAFAAEIVDAVEEALGNPRTEIGVDGSPHLMPVKVFCEAIEVDDSGIAEFLIGFYHATMPGNPELVHTLILRHVRHLYPALNEKEWERTYAGFPGSAATYVQTIEFDLR